MKKRFLALILALCIICTMLTSCEVIELINNIFGLFGVGEGDTNNEFDIDVNLGTTTVKPEECKNHNLATKDGVAPTCTTTGLTEGKVCTNCNTVVIEQSVLPMLPHTYDDNHDTSCNVCGMIRELECDHVGTVITVAGRDPSCTGTGLTEGEKCQECGVVTVHQTIIPALGHVFDDPTDEYCNRCNAYIHKECPHTNTTVIEGKAATCIQPGLTSGVYCNDCNTVVTAQTATPVAEHNDGDKDGYCDVCFVYSPCKHKNTEIIPGYAATCTEKGLTNGEICLDCDSTLTGQTVIPALDHTESDWIVDVEPTITSEGSQHTECTACGITIKTEKVEMLSASQGLTFSLNADGESYTVIDIGSCTDTRIVIPSQYNGKPVTAIGESAFLNNTAITSITVSEGITSIERAAFRKCSNLLTVNLPSTLTDLGPYAFCDCDALKTISLPEQLTSLGSHAFYGCDTLKSIYISEQITEIKEYTFYDCYNLTNINMLSGITVIGSYAFYNCDSLKELNFLPSSLKEIKDHAFNECSGLTKVTLPVELETIGCYGFSWCQNLKNVTLFSNIKFIGTGVFDFMQIYVTYKGTWTQWEAVTKEDYWGNSPVVICSD